MFNKYLIKINKIYFTFVQKKTMFGLFKKVSEVSKLEKQYKKLLEEAYKLSTSNRNASDNKQHEAQQVLEKIEALKAKESKESKV